MPSSVELWNEAERPQTLADKSFAPTSIMGVEEPDDTEPVAFQANRAAMAANGASELRQLHGLNQQTTAYPSIGCTVGAMSPSYSGGAACDVAAVEERSHGITAYTQGTALLPRFDAQRAERCASMEAAGVGLSEDPSLVARASGEPPIGYEARELKKPRMHHLTTRMANSVRGALYDLQHFDELPPARSGSSPGAVTTFALTRDNRTPYLLLVLVFVLVLIATVSMVRSLGAKK